MAAVGPLFYFKRGAARVSVCSWTWLAYTDLLIGLVLHGVGSVLLVFALKHGRSVLFLALD
jgi:hypothetical protein